MPTLYQPTWFARFRSLDPVCEPTERPAVLIMSAVPDYIDRVDRELGARHKYGRIGGTGASASLLKFSAWFGHG